MEAARFGGHAVPDPTRVNRMLGLTVIATSRRWQRDRSQRLSSVEVVACELRGLGSTERARRNFALAYHSIEQFGVAERSEQ